ncbi:MAG: hypothetical protein FWE71_16680 [Nocardioidaceae bacterium]|nr:hypothetical protein [Nocardioidaceae bacterium]MCL2614970.1 hypothetical protein [Nocardioidaceae bacterium]
MGRRPAGKRYRAGLYFPLSNLVLGIVMLAAIGGVDVIGVLAATNGAGSGDRAWAVVALVMSLLGVVLGLAWLRLGINALRPIVVDDESLHLPVLGPRVGWSWRSIALRDVAGVEMVFLREPRNGRWQLSIIRMRGSTLTSDSLTSGRARGRGVSGTSAARCAEELRRSLPSRELS